MSLLPLFQSLEALAIGQTIRDSLWLFPLIESIHLIALASIGGAILVLDLRMLGMGLRGRTVPEVARDAHKWFVVSLIIMVLSGTGLFLSEAIKCYYSSAFWVKISTLPIAILFALTIRRRVSMRAEEQTSPLLRAAVAIVSLSLWFTIGAAGRWIGFS